MPSLVIGPMLRFVGPRSATVFVETDCACVVRVLGHATPTFCVRGHHFALVVITGLEPGTTTEYDVRLDDRRVWPPDDVLVPPSVIRTVPDGGPELVMFGSCREAAPHERPFTLELAFDERGRGVDALWAHSRRMQRIPPEDWPHLVLMCGDQVYADDTSPETRERIARRRSAGEDLPDDLVRDFEEYSWLYRESWHPIDERWFFSVVPSVMIFDDHDVIDDWNISCDWVADIDRQRWWPRHIMDGLMSYWIYQHLGNLSPEELAADGLLAELLTSDDPTTLLEERAKCWNRRTPSTGGQRFSVVRELATTRVVVIDTRNARLLEPGARHIVEPAELAWVAERCFEPVDHLVLVSSLPVFVPGALHDLQAWNEAVVDGAWGRSAARVAERLRRFLDLEDWPAFSRSFDALSQLILQLATSSGAPETITVVSGDIHFSYFADIRFHGARTTSEVRQVVCSPLRNALAPVDRYALRVALSRIGRVFGRILRRGVGKYPTTAEWEMTDGPVFGNCVGFMTFDGCDSRVWVERASDSDERGPVLELAFEERGLVRPRRGTHRS